MKVSLALSHVTQRLQGVVGDVWKVPYMAASLQQQGVDVIRLCVGDPDFDTPSQVCNEAAKQLAQGRTHYSSAQGEWALRNAVAQQQSKTSGRPCDAERVVVFPGGTNALYSVLSCLLNREDELIVPEPMYIGYCGLLAATGCLVTHVPLRVEDNFSLDIEAIKAAVTVKTRVVLVNTPGNPAGNMLSAEQLAELARFCLAKGIWLVCDEVYAMITFDRQHVSLYSTAKQLDNVVVVNSLSKSHAMSGWRVGWVIAPASLVPSLVNFADSTLYGCAQFIQDAAVTALLENNNHVCKMREQYRLRRDYVVRRIDSIDSIHCLPPAAGMFVMADVSATGFNGDQFAMALLKSQKVSLVPGGGFGANTQHFVRITLAQPIAVLEQAFDRIEAFLSCQRR